MIKQIISSLITILFSSLAVCMAQGPNIHLNQENYDFGKVLYGATVSYRFIIKNIGSQPLIIKKIQTDCGCTTTVLDNKELSPNSSTELITSFETTGLSPGKKQKKIYVDSNDPEHPTRVLTLMAEVIREVSVNQLTLAKKIDHFEPKHVFDIKVTNTSVAPKTIKSARVGENNTSVTLTPDHLVVPPNSTLPLSIEVSLDGENIKPYYLGKVFLGTDHPIEQEIELKYLIKIDKP